MSKQKPYSSKKKIEDTESSINLILEPWGNKVYVFDFGHYYFDENLNKDNDDDNRYVFKTVIKGSKQYIDALFPDRKDDSTEYKYFESNIKEVCNISSEENNKYETGTFSPPIKEIVANKEFKTSDWAKDLKKSKIGGCLLVSSIKEGNHQSAVWVVLEKPIKGLIKEKTYCFMSCEVCSKREGNDCSKGLVSLKDDKIQGIFDQIDDLLKNELMYNTELRTNSEIYRQSTRAAITQVFVRNIVRNNIPTILDNLSKEESLSTGLYQQIFEQNAYMSNIEVEKFQLVANLVSYVANRIKYLNDATLEAKYVKKNNLEDWSVYKLFKDFDANRILLNHIPSKKAFKYKIVFMHNKSIITAYNDISVSLPKGDLGAQAFFNILENIISNTAEHGEIETDVVFTVNFDDKEPLDCDHPFPDERKFFRVEIWDDVPIRKGAKNLSKEIEDIKNDAKKLEEYNQYFGIDVSKYKEKDTVNTYGACTENEEDKIKDTADLLVYQQNTRLNKSVIDPKTHKLRYGSLGLIEMEASAAFLRQEDIPEIEGDNYNLKHGQYYNENEGKYFPYFIQAFKNELQDGKYSLGHRFYMKKPDIL